MKDGRMAPKERTRITTLHRRIRERRKEWWFSCKHATANPDWLEQNALLSPAIFLAVSMGIHQLVRHHLYLASNRLLRP